MDYIKAMETLTDIARNAYLSGQQSTYLLSSPADMAHRTGEWLHSHGYYVPSVVRQSRGHRMRAKCGPSEVVLDFGPDSKRPVRVA